MSQSCQLEFDFTQASRVEEPPVLHIPLGGKRGAGKCAIVLDDEFTRSVLATQPWCLSSYGYAVRNGPGSARRISNRGHVFLHRLVFEHYHGPIPAGKEVDHINRNRLDNRPSNLRAVTRSQNIANRGRQSNNTSGFDGVCWCKRDQKWYARVKVQGKHHFLGRFHLAREAADAVNEAYLRYFPGIAVPNPREVPVAAVA